MRPLSVPRPSSNAPPAPKEADEKEVAQEVKPPVDGVPGPARRKSRRTVRIPDDSIPEAPAYLAEVDAAFKRPRT